MEALQNWGRVGVLETDSCDRGQYFHSRHGGQNEFVVNKGLRKKGDACMSTTPPPPPPPPPSIETRMFMGWFGGSHHGGSWEPFLGKGGVQPGGSHDPPPPKSETEKVVH